MTLPDRERGCTFGEQTERGFGFIVGENTSGVLYAVTALHVVVNPDDVDNETAPKVEVELYEHRGETIEAKVLGTRDERHDLAVITFPKPDDFEWDRKSLGRDDQQNDETDVWFVGRLAKWYVPTKPGTIISEEPVDARMEIEDLSVQPGSSGGPLIASSGIVGMVLKDSAEATTALSIRFIRKMVRDEWRHPWKMVDSAPPHPNDELAAKGKVIAREDPVFAALREQQPKGAARRGFDIAMAAAHDQTAWGPGKQAMLDALEGAEQEGFRVGAYFAVDRNKNLQGANTGARIAEEDPVVEEARMRERDPRYWLGFDIATAIFGDRAKGAQGNTATGPGSLGIRDSLLTPMAKKGFDASVKLHLSRRY